MITVIGLNNIVIKAGEPTLREVISFCNDYNYRIYSFNPLILKHI
jgi:hypothetical protein